MNCWYPPELPDDKETTLILAGDLWVGTRFIEFAGYSWIGDVAPRFKQVLIVLGNHDYWPGNKALTILKGGDTCNAMLQEHGLDNVKVLDMDNHVDGDVMFVGATLWTDMNKCDPLTMHNMSNCMAYDGKISFNNGKDGAWERFTSQKWVDTHRNHKQYIEMMAKNNPDKKIVVITHHQPLEMMGDPLYKGHEANAYYYSDLSELILDNTNIAAWICGHSHIGFDEQFEHCRLLMNAVGYSSEHREQKGEVKHEVIEL